MKHTLIVTQTLNSLHVGGREEGDKTREVACLPGLSSPFTPVLLFVEGAEGHAAALHSSSHICGKTAAA